MGARDEAFLSYKLVRCGVLEGAVTMYYGHSLQFWHGHHAAHHAYPHESEFSLASFGCLPINFLLTPCQYYCLGREQRLSRKEGSR
jgi:hypothetical protein